jgi:hypothetical protein
MSCGAARAPSNQNTRTPSILLQTTQPSGETCRASEQVLVGSSCRAVRGDSPPASLPVPVGAVKLAAALVRVERCTHVSLSRPIVTAAHTAHTTRSGVSPTGRGARRRFAARGWANEPGRPTGTHGRSDRGHSSARDRAFSHPQPTLDVWKPCKICVAWHAYVADRCDIVMLYERKCQGTC